MKLPGLDQGRDLRLRLADAPRRPVALAHLGRFAPVGGFEHLVSRLSHAIFFISTTLICVNAVDMIGRPDYFRVAVK